MKKLIIVFTLLAFALAGYSQSFQGFFKPVKSHFQTKDIDKSFALLFRPVFSVTAMRFVPTGDDRIFETSSFNSFGTGLAVNHYIMQPDGNPFLNYGFNFLILYDAKIGDVTPAGLSLALSVTGLSIVNVGAGYSFPLKKPFILTGIAYSF